MPAYARDGRTGARRRLLRSALGDVLRQIRLDQRRTLADVSGQARISMPYLSEVERGRKEASSEVLAALCDALGVPLSRVLGEVGRELAADAAERARLLRPEAAENARREVVDLLARARRPRSSTGSVTSSVTGSVTRSGGGSGDVLLLAA